MARRAFAPICTAALLLSACSAEPSAEYITLEQEVMLRALLEDATLVNDAGCLVFEVPPDSALMSKRFRAAFPASAEMDGDTVSTDSASYAIGTVSDVEGGMFERPSTIDVVIPAVCDEDIPIWAVSS